MKDPKTVKDAVCPRCQGSAVVRKAMDSAAKKPCPKCGGTGLVLPPRRLLTK